MSASTLERLERLLVMVPWLLERDGATFDELALRFDADRDRLVADLDLLGYCGLLGYGGGDLIQVLVQGDHVRVRMADFFSRPLRLSLREAVTLLLATRALSQLQGLPESDALDRAVQRLERLIGEAAPIDADEVRVAVDLRSDGDEHVAALREAVQHGYVVELTYRSASRAQTTRRSVEPWAVVGHGGAWYLQGWCRQAIGYREFRLDRIASLEVSEERSPARSRQVPVEPGYVPGPDDLRAVVEVDRPAWWMLDGLVVDRVQEQGDVRRVELQVATLDWLARWVFAGAGSVRAVEPADLVATVRDRAERLLSVYADHAPQHGLT